MEEKEIIETIDETLNDEQLNEVVGGRTRVKIQKQTVRHGKIVTTAVWKWLDQCSEEDKEYIVGHQEYKD